MAIRLQKMAIPIIKQLTTFISMQNENVTNVTVVAFGSKMNESILKIKHDHTIK